MRFSSISYPRPGSPKTAIAAALVAGVVGFASCSREAAPPPAPASKDAIGGPAGHYAGSEACRGCHASEYASWEASRHHRTLTPWQAGRPLPLAGTSLEPPYRVSEDGSVEGPGATGGTVAGRVVFVLGGRHRSDLVVRLDDGRRQVYPVSYDHDARQAFQPIAELAGGAPPPDVVDFWTRMGRNADLACYGCHATAQVLTVEGRDALGVPVVGSRWTEPGVGCEACHGPCGEHASQARPGAPATSGIRLTRATPAALAVDICAGCHALREVLPSPFESAPAHRYGEPVYAAALPLLSSPSNFEFHDAVFADLRPGTYQQEAVALAQSGCARRGGLACRACHDPHGGGLAPAVTAADGGDSICAPCHRAIVDRGTAHTLGHAPGHPGGRCLDCHMPAVLRGPARAAARDHALAPPVAEAGRVPAACAACHAGRPNAAAVATAWGRVAARAGAKRRAIASAMTGALEGRIEAARALAAMAVDTRATSWFERFAAVERLGLTERAPAPEALRAAVREALDDANPAVRRAAARALGRMGTKDDIPALETASRDADPWAALEAAGGLEALHAFASTARVGEILARPELVTDARAQSVFGHALLAAHEAPRAEAALRRALQLNPVAVPVMNDLGLALLAQGRREEAVAEWKRALALNPRFQAARDNLAVIAPSR